MNLGVLVALVAIATGGVQGAVLLFGVGKWSGRIDGRFTAIESSLADRKAEIAELRRSFEQVFVRAE